MASYEQGTISAGSVYRTLLNRLRDFATNDHVATAVVAAGGTGYSVGDILTVSGGTPSTVACTAQVLTLSGSAVATVKIRQSGAYSANPSTPAATTVVPAGGTGCTLTLTFTGVLWTVNRDDQTAPHDATEIELQLQGVGDGADAIYVGVRSYNIGGVAHNWELSGFTGFNAGLSWANQAGKSPGPVDTPIASNNGAFVLLSNAISTDYWFNVDGRRIICVFKVGNNFSSMYLGWLNQYATSTEYPYPLLVMGCSNDADQVHSSSVISYSGISDPVRVGSSGVGPGFVRFTDGQWYSIFNSDNVSGGRDASTALVVLPAGNAPTPSGADLWYATSDRFNGVVPQSAIPGVPAVAWAPTDDSGGNIFPLLPCTLLMATPSVQLLGEMDDVYWVPAFGTLTPEDVINTDFTAFQCGNRTEDWAFFAMRTLT